jgi:hypothetical protein
MHLQLTRYLYGKKRTVLFILWLLATSVMIQDLNAQCATMTINTLQVLQRAVPGERESKILAAGFDLRQAVTTSGTTSKVYSKCWMTTIKGTSYFDQKIIWNLHTDSIKFATLNEGQFQALRQEVDARHPHGVGAVVVDGKMFRYYFGVEKMDGADYWTLALTKR